MLRPQNGHISESSNSALAIAKGEWVAVSTILDKAYTVSTLKTFTARHGATGIGPLKVS